MADVDVLRYLIAHDLVTKVTRNRYRGKRSPPSATGKIYGLQVIITRAANNRDIASIAFNVNTVRQVNLRKEDRRQ